MALPLLTTKLYIPRPRPNLVPRPRLIQRLDEGVQQGCRLTLVSAPAGFGKTTLIAGWIHQMGDAMPPLSAAWLSLDDDDNDPTRFFTYLISALERVQPEVGADALSLLQSPQPPPLKSVLTILINSLATPPNDSPAALGHPPEKQLVLVLDDYHAIRQESIHEAMTFLLDHMPPHMHLVIASRVDPALPLSGLRARGQLAELRASDLRFTTGEAATFLNQVMDLDLTAEHIAALETRTEGWIAGLQLAALSMQGRQDLPGFIAAFTGSQHYILDYLMEEVLQRQTESVQAFLLQTSILERMSGPLCDAVLSNEASASGQETLDYLEHANLFVVPLDDHQEWYRYHRLFADFLRARLHQTQPKRVPELHRRASAWHEQSAAWLGDDRLVAPAIGHACAAGDYEHAADLIEQVAESTFMRSEVATLQSWIEALPDPILRTRPLLCAYDAWALVLSGHPLEVVEARLQEAAEADTAGSTAGEIATFRAVMAVYRRDRRQSIELSQQALDLLPENSLFLRSLVAGFLGLNYLYGGDIVGGRQALGEAARISEQVGNLMNMVLALVHLAELSHLEGQISEARAFYNRALEAAVDGRGRPRPIAGLALIGLGNLLYERNDLEAAARHLQQGVELILKWGEVGAINGYVGLAMVKQAQGDVEGARQAIQAGQKLAEKFDAMQVDDFLVALVQARLWIAQGNLEAVTRWAEERGLGDVVHLDELEGDYLRAAEYVVLAQLRFAQEQSGAALKVLEPMLQVAEAAGWTGVVIEILALRSVAFQAQGDAARAKTALERALILAEPEGHVRVFLDQGAPMAEMLSAFSRQRSATAPLQPYVSKLLSAFALERSRPGPEAPREDSQVEGPRPSLLIEPLSERELEVLRLVAAGLSNREIADDLVVAVSTVKTHINNIYRKLDVSKRTQAVARARELKLL